MVNEDFGNKLKKLKSKTTKRKKSDISQYKTYIILSIVAIGLLFGAYILYNSMQTKGLEEAQKFEDSKKSAITNINQMFSKYPTDPRKITYISKITEAKSSADIEKIINEASAYLNYKDNQQSKIVNIKNICGSHYPDCVYAQSIVNKIENAQSNQEINSILTNEVLDKIYEESEKKYLEEVNRKLEFGEYFNVGIGVTKKLMSKEEALDYVSKMSLNELKQLSIEEVSFNLLTLTVSASQCGKIPMEGDYIYIYDKGSLDAQQSAQQAGTAIKPIECVVNASYVIAKDITYSESKSVSSSVSDSGGSSSASSSSSISYSLSSVNGILHATAVDKLEYNKIKSKFGNYGIKLNKIEDETQIFDGDVQYLLIVSVPSDSVPEIISMDSNNMYIVRAG